MTHFELFKTGRIAFHVKSQKERTAIARIFNCDPGIPYSSTYPYIAYGSPGQVSGNASPEPFVAFESVTDFFSANADGILGRDVKLQSKRIVKVFRDCVKVGQLQFSKEELKEMLEKISEGE